MRGIIELSKIHTIFPKIAFVGCGNMVEAFLRGIGPILDSKKYVVASPSLCTGTRSTSHPVALNNRDAVTGAKLIVYGAKPKDFKVILNDIAPCIDKDAVFLSMAAGIPTTQITPYCKYNARFMPNTPVNQKLGVISRFASPFMPLDQLAWIDAMLETIGYVLPLDKESDMDPATAFYASGAGFLFLILEYLESIADELNFMAEDPIARRKCLIQLMKGSAVLLENNDLSFEAARRQVTSPNGTTHAGVTTMENLSLKHVLRQGLKAAIERSKEMGKDPGKVSAMSVFKPEIAVESENVTPNSDLTKKYGN